SLLTGDPSIDAQFFISGSSSEFLSKILNKKVKPRIKKIPELESLIIESKGSGIEIHFQIRKRTTKAVQHAIMLLKIFAQDLSFQRRLQDGRSPFL
ncbi:MAG: hypothetical protein ACXAB4_10325, partial [Candidatus Hodarchaeales archaeon]